jgi:hypothetical protein
LLKSGLHSTLASNAFILVMPSPSVLGLYPTQFELTFQNLGLKMVQRKPNLHTGFPGSAILFTGKILPKSEIKNSKTILEILSCQN